MNIFFIFSFIQININFILNKVLNINQFILLFLTKLAFNKLIIQNLQLLDYCSKQSTDMRYPTYILLKILINHNKMKKAFALVSMIACAFSEFSEELTQKYSIEVLNGGDEGTQPNTGDAVSMHYDGTLIDGTKFDSSYERGQPLDIRIGRGQVIKCWDDVGVHLNINQKVRVVCPSDTAYGNRAIGPIPANSDLVFIIERVK